jgi:hypothetical protein
MWMGSSMIALGAMVAMGCDNDTTGPGDTGDPEVVKPLLISGYLSAESTFILVSQAGRHVTNALVTVNGVQIPPKSDGDGYTGAPPEALPAGRLVLEVKHGGQTVQGVGNMPEAPVLTAPATGTVFALSDSIAVTWTSAADPHHFDVKIAVDCFIAGPCLEFELPGTTRGLKIAASDIGLSDEVFVTVRTGKEGSLAFSGPADPDSQVSLRGERSQSVIAIQQ